MKRPLVISLSSDDEEDEPKRSRTCPHAELEDMGDDLIAAIDPGTVHFGLDVYQPLTDKHVMMQIDYTLRRDPSTGRLRQIQVRDKDLCKLADYITSDYADVFRKCACIVVENQPPAERRKRGQVSFIPFEYAIRASLMAKFPKAHVFSVRSQTMRSFFGTSGKSHEHRKRLSWWFSKWILKGDDARRCAETFGITDGAINVDPLECMLYSEYAKHNYAKLVKLANAPFQFKPAHRRNTNDNALKKYIVRGTRLAERLEAAKARKIKKLGDYAAQTHPEPRPTPHIIQRRLR